MKKIKLNRTYISTSGNMREITPFKECGDVPGVYWCHIVECVDVDEDGNDINKEYDGFLTTYDITH